MRENVALFVLLALAATVSCSSLRDKRLLSVFNVVRFQNEPCTGGTKNGTCYTADECTSKGGSNVGACASGYGVCCSFSVGCGGTTRENCTYFENGANQAAGGCSLEVCKCADNICQLRLDFATFVIAGPSTATTTVTNLLGGAGTTASVAGTCATESFSVSAPGGVSPPVICGTNSNMHMYVDASASCNRLNFLLAQSSTAMFSIKVSQIPCDSEVLPPAGCTQYFYGSNTGTINTFNFAGGRHLANQNQNICFRRERSSCRICYTPAMRSDFSVSGFTGSSTQASSSGCCRTAATAAASGSNGYDCVSIPGARDGANPSLVAGPLICGRSMGTAANTAMTFTRCSTVQPFQIRFLSDNFEVSAAGVGEANVPQKGFLLNYKQDSTNC